MSQLLNKYGLSSGYYHETIVLVSGLDSQSRVYFQSPLL